MNTIIGLRRLLLVTGAVIALLVIAVVALCLWLAVRYNQFRDFPSDGRFVCRQIAAVPSGEDIAIDWVRQQAFISSSAGIFRVDLEGDLAAVNITPQSLRGRLIPHGLSLHVAPDGSRSLFLINHAQGKSVAILAVANNGDLTLTDEVRGPVIRSPNDLVAIGPRQFYITNESRLAAEKFASPTNAFKVLSGWDATGTIFYFDGQRFHPAAEGLSYANGINVSPDGRHIYVAETTGKQVSVFARTRMSHRLVPMQRIALPGGPDNIDVAPGGDLFVAVIPRLLEAVAHTFQFSAKRPPAQVIRIASPDSTPRLETVWTDDGSRIAAASVGAPYGKVQSGYLLLVGSFANDPPLACVPR